MHALVRVLVGFGTPVGQYHHLWSYRPSPLVAPDTERGSSKSTKPKRQETKSDKFRDTRDKGAHLHMASKSCDFVPQRLSLRRMLPPHLRKVRAGFTLKLLALGALKQEEEGSMRVARTCLVSAGFFCLLLSLCARAGVCVEALCFALHISQ